MTRSSTPWLLLGLLAATAAAPCRAAIRWYDDYSEGHEAAKKLCRPMVVVFDIEDERRRGTAKRLFEKSKLAPLHRLFVFIHIGLTVKNGTVSHALFHKFPPGQGQISFPLVFFAGTDEKVLGKNISPHRTSDLFDQMVGIVRKLGGPAAAAKAREAQQTLERADALLAAKRYGAAARLYKAVVGLGAGSPATETAKKQFAAIAEMAAKRLQAARADVADKAYPAAVRKLRELARAFAPLPEAKQARDELARLGAMPEVKAALADARGAESHAARRQPTLTDDPGNVDDDFFTDDELDALDKMAGGQPPPDADGAKAAAAECRRLLTLARSWMANDRPDKARELLEKVVALHPGTLYARQAAALLEKLR